MTDVLTGPVKGQSDCDLERLGRAEPDVNLTRRQLGLVLSGGTVAALVAGGLAARTWPASPPSGGVTRGLGTWTSFGTVVVLMAERRARRAAGAVGHTGHGASTDARDEAWTDEVTLDLAVHNGTDHPVLVSPGQLRLRMGPSGPTVTPFDPGRTPGPVEPGATEQLRISYLAPADARDLTAEFSDPLLDDVLLLELPSAVGPSSDGGTGS